MTTPTTPGAATREDLDRRIEQLSREVAVKFLSHTEEGRAWLHENWESPDRDAAIDAVQAVPGFSGLFYWAVLHHLEDTWEYVSDQLFDEAHRVANKEQRADIRTAVENFLNSA